MPRNVTIAASLPAPPDRLYDMYLDSAAHSAFTGAPAIVSAQAGAAFSAFGGVLSGTMLHVAPKRLIVHTWRSTNWPAEAMDGILVLSFWPESTGGRIELVHVNVPDVDFAGVSQRVGKVLLDAVAGVPGSAGIGPIIDGKQGKSMQIRALLRHRGMALTVVFSG